MKKHKRIYFILSIFVCVSFIIKLILIFKYKNQLTLSSDDLNYIKSAVVLGREGTFVFHNYNEPTVFIMPLYPLFLASVFKIFGYGLAGLQMVRIIQAFLSCLTIVIVFFTAKELFDEKVALVTAFLVAFYVPNIVTVGYALTETLFTTLLCFLVYLSIKFSHSPTNTKFAVLGIMWAAVTLCRPTIALYPILLFAYLFLFFRLNLSKMFRLGISMLIPFIILMSPWWVRNYLEYNTFIPLTASSGNPMLQGTYVDYRQTPENIVYYKLGKNAYETNKNEMETAENRIKDEFKKDFWGYLRWYTLGKTLLMWGTIFYWKEFFGVGWQFVGIFHYFILLGFIGILILLFNNFFKYLLPVSLIIYINVIHCIYMAFDRYAFPVIPLLSIFCAFFAVRVYSASKKLIFSIL